MALEDLKGWSQIAYEEKRKKEKELHAPRTKLGERIYEGRKGGWYIIKENKNGTPYRHYLPPESIN